MKQKITACKIVTCTHTTQWIAFSTCHIYFIYFYYMPYFKHQSGALKEEEPVSESLRVPWMKLGAQLCPHPKLPVYPAQRFTKRTDSWPVSFEQEESHRSFWKERAKGGIDNTRKRSASKHIPKLMSKEWEHPYCNSPCLHSILKITCSFDPVKNSGREGGEM